MSSHPPSVGGGFFFSDKTPHAVHPISPQDHQKAITVAGARIASPAHASLCETLNSGSTSLISSHPPSVGGGALEHCDRLGPW
eukprot:CAMPEP_0204449754 /NCGR_PEP_ID=MMETSP0470-20130426/99999_1 /ASSEMBLY_ACC=CAM_ASM_000385 /TAXON_ID=2969 /ORGANISM="Oxyrrhis marina" /LENGTH=82 /DNA_ID=CAMNT_0051449577 /DNA_START=391 /DNA_END=639 /DNA_ORIENTATION=-